MTGSERMAAPAGWIHSLETLGALDGPGLRLVVFLQGCPLRCRYCHNPDTWAAGGGQMVSVAELVRRALRFQPYFGTSGGVTLSGGEPLMQPEFTAALLRELKTAGLSTALDTSGWLSEETPGQPSWLPEILDHADLVILDVKSPTPEQFRWLTGRGQSGLCGFVEACARRRQRLWIRQVIVPGWNDQPEDIVKLAGFLEQWPDLRLEKVELLPYHTLGEDKWRRLGQAYPLAGVPALNPEILAGLQTLADGLIRLNPGPD